MRWPLSGRATLWLFGAGWTIAPVFAVVQACRAAALPVWATVALALLATVLCVLLAAVVLVVMDGNGESWARRR